VTASDRINDELDRILAENPHLFHEVLEAAQKVHRDLATNPAGFVDEYQKDGSGRGFILEVLPRHDQFALWVQFTIVPRDRLAQIARESSYWVRARRRKVKTAILPSDRESRAGAIGDPRRSAGTGTLLKRHSRNPGQHPVGFHAELRRGERA
jgi:hypothetical protein